MAKKKRRPERAAVFRLSFLAGLFYFIAFLLLWGKEPQWPALALAFGVPAGIWLGAHLLPRLFPVDPLLMTLTNFLCALGLLVLLRTNPALAYRQLLWYGPGLIALVTCAALVRAWRGRHAPHLLLILVSVALLALPLLIGTEKNGARNWVTLGGLSFQPSEPVKLSLLILTAGAMSRRRHLAWLLPTLAFLGLLLLQKDLGTALIYYGTVLLMYFAAGGHPLLLLAGAAGGAGAAVLGYQMFAHVKKRVAIWRNPWADPQNAGYQIVQSLIALAGGGLFGVGLGLGAPTAIPVYETDFIFTVICEQFGLIFGLCVIAVYALLLWRGAEIAGAARSGRDGLLAMGCTIMLGLQTFLIVGGVVKLIPLTGVTLPFISHGGSSLVTSMGLIGLLSGVNSLNEADLRQEARIAQSLPEA